MMSDATWDVITLSKKVEPDLAADLEKNGAYVHPDILKVRVEDGAKVRFATRPGADARAVREKVGRYVDAMVSRFRQLPKKVLHERKREDRGPLATGVYAELKRRGWVIEEGRGQVALRGPALNLLRAIDDDCRATIGVGAFGAQEEVYPTLIGAKTLGRCGYFSSFPQSVSMVTHLVEDYDRIERFRQANASTTDLTVPDFSAFTTPEACCSPAVCYHAYRNREGAKLAGCDVVTCVGKCFRYESTNITGLDRLWDFTMREVVFVGTEDEVTTRRQRGIEFVEAQVERFDLSCTIETANDPFFSAAYATKTYYQVRGDLKYELRLDVEPDDRGEARTIACASFNLHESFFGKTFSITASDGQPAFTGCLAWGLERWIPRVLHAARLRSGAVARRGARARLPVARMSAALDNLLLRIKRRDTPVARTAYDALHRLYDLDVPDTDAMRLLFGGAFVAQHLLVDAREWAKSKLWYAPMSRSLRARRQGAQRDERAVRARPREDHHRRALHLLEPQRAIRPLPRRPRARVRRRLLRRVGRDVPAQRLDHGWSSRAHRRQLLGAGLGRTSVRMSSAGCAARRSSGKNIAPVAIHDHAWLGRGAQVLKGVTIGRGAVIAAGSVVVGDVPDGALAMGVPARVLKR